jgi:hypothetical protein
MSQFDGDSTPITATTGSLFYQALQCTPSDSNTGSSCTGTAGQWIQANFSDWDVDSVPWNVLYMIGAILVTRVVTFVALTNLDYRAN